MLTLIGISLCFLALSGLVAMIDAAVLSVSHAEVQETIVKQQRGAQSLKRVKDKITRSLIVIVILTNSINILGPIAVGQVATRLYGDSVIGLVVALLTLGTIVCSEIIPKSIGSHFAPTISRWSAPFVLTLVYLLYPLVLALEKLSDAFIVGKRKIGTEEQIRSLALLGRRARHIERDEGRLIQRAFLLNDSSAKDLMTPLPEVIGFKNTDCIAEAAENTMKYEYSRYPVFGADSEQIKGIVLGRDVLEAFSKNKGSQKVSTLLREVPVVSADKRADQLLIFFQKGRPHLALVQEDGKTIGIVALEDVLEELVGDIEDEKDQKDT